MRMTAVAPAMASFRLQQQMQSLAAPHRQHPCCHYETGTSRTSAPALVSQLPLGAHAPETLARQTTARHKPPHFLDLQLSEQLLTIFALAFEHDTGLTQACQELYTSKHGKKAFRHTSELGLLSFAGLVTLHGKYEMDILSFGSGAPWARQPDHSSFSVRVEPRQEAEGSCTSHAVVVHFVAEQAGPHSTSFDLSIPKFEGASSVQVRMQHLWSPIAHILQASWDVTAQKQALCTAVVCASSCCQKLWCADISSLF